MVNAVVSTGNRAVYVAVNPVRILDTRNSSKIVDDTRRLVVEGVITVVDGTSYQIVPTDATAVAINITATSTRKNGNYGFVTAYPCTSSSDSPPNASSLNFENGVDIANALNVTTSANGSICLHVHGTADLIVDIAGYYVDHDHDDRYYTKAQVDTGLASKADNSDLYHPVVASAPNTIDSTGDVGRYTSITIGLDGNPIISYWDLTNGSLKVAACDNPTCTTATVSTIDSVTNNGAGTSIAIGADGNPIISYMDNGNTRLRVAACTNPTCDTTISAATTSTIDSVSNSVARTSIAIGTDGNPIISYIDNGNTWLRVAACTNPTCDTTISAATTSTIDSVGVGSFRTSIAIGIDGNPVISYYDATNTNLKVAVCDEPTCSTATKSTIDNGGDVGFSSSIVIGIQGLPVISYYDTTNGDLKVAVCDEPMCSTASKSTIVVSSGDVGPDSSIAIGIDGNPIIGYLDFTNGDLKVAVCPNSYCILMPLPTLSTVDTTGSVGWFPSIAIGANGVPIISYYDVTNGDLKVASAWWLAGGR
ncbi:MAG: hypothetical protein EBX99_01075 [Acidimicrobiia bacterium]|nr:hypothetical protein [Acidimicrobiia bacterium]